MIRLEVQEVLSFTRTDVLLVRKPAELPKPAPPTITVVKTRPGRFGDRLLREADAPPKTAVKIH